jgi:hypothetical protein
LKSDTTEVERKEHKAIMYGLVSQGLINDDELGFLKMTESGTQKVYEITEPMTLEQIALILISFCENENIKYHILDGVVRKGGYNGS